MKKFVAILTLWMALEPVSALARTEIGIGAKSCGAWTEVRLENGFNKRVYQSWVVGYLSGANTLTIIDILEESDAEGLWAWIDNFCRANPLKEIGDATNELGAELLKSRR